MKIAILDTETIGKVSQDLLNIACVVVDLDTTNNTYKTQDIKTIDIAISTLYNNKVYMLNDDFVGAKKLAYYENGVKNKSIKKHTLKNALKQIKKFLDKNKVQFIYAYNCNFDTKLIAKECEKIGVENILKDYKVLDIWGYACEKVVETKEYKKFCLENDFKTATDKYWVSNAETVYRYLNKNVDFVEKHTALEDCFCELDILCKCCGLGSNITKYKKPKLIRKGV